MNKGRFAKHIGVVVLGLAVSHCTKPTARQPQDALRTSSPTATATPKPTLMLSLPKSQVVATAISHTRSNTLIIPTPASTPTATPFPQIIQELSRLSVSIDEKNRPVISYKFAEGKSPPVQATR